MKLPNTVGIGALLGCIILLVFLFRAQNQLDLANAALASLKAQNADLSARAADLENHVVDDSVLKRLQADQREAIKLRGEVANLKNSVAAAEKKAAAAAAAAQKPSASKTPQLATENPADSRYARVLSRKLNANVGLGHGLLFGGWQSQPGKQAFGMAVPSRDPSGGDTVEIQTKWFEVSDEVLAKLDATTATTLLRAAGQQANMTPDQLAAFLKTLDSTPGIDTISSPAMTISSGRQGRVTVGNSLQTPEGATIELGPAMDFIPTLSADGSSVDLVVDAKLTLPKTPPSD